MSARFTSIGGKNNAPVVDTCRECGREFSSRYAAKNHVCRGKA